MTQVLAVLGGGPAEAPVIDTAAALAEIAHAQVRRVSLAGDLSAERAAAQVLGALDSPGTVLAVLARDERSRPIWRRVAQRSARPVVLVPAAARGRRPEIRRVLLPLDGTAESAAAVAGAVEQFARAGVDLVVLHVFDAETVPRFWDQAAHARRGLGRGVPGTLLRAAGGAAGAPDRGGRGARPGRGGGRTGRHDRTGLVAATRPGPGTHGPPGRAGCRCPGDAGADGPGTDGTLGPAGRPDRLDRRTGMRVHAVCLDAGSALAPPSRCAGCGAEGLTAVTGSERTSFSCGSCGLCWQVELGWVHRVDGQGRRARHAGTRCPVRPHMIGG